MRTLLVFISLIFLASACGTSKSYLDRKNELRAITAAIKKLQKSPEDPDATMSLPILYNRIQNDKLAQIESYERKNDLGRWQKILDNYNTLQNIHDDIVKTPAAIKLINPVNYANEIIDIRYRGADEWYNAAEVYYNAPYKSEIRKAAEYYRKASSFVSNFKDANARINDAINRSVLNVIINPVSVSLSVHTHGIDMLDIDLRGNAFQSQLLRDLNGFGTLSSDKARFYSNWDADQARIIPDRIVNIYLSGFSFPPPSESVNEREISQQIQIGKDTSGKAIYKTYYGKIRTVTRLYSASISMNIVMTDLERNKNENGFTRSESNSWNEQFITFSGDRRALSSADIDLIEKSENNRRTLYSILSELYLKIYPEIKRDIEFSLP